MKNKCLYCDFYNEDFGCVCPSYERWYACSYYQELDEDDFRKMNEGGNENENDA